MTTQTKDFPITLAANASIRIPVSAQFLRILAATGTFSLQTDMVNLSSVGVGDGFEKTPYTFLTFTDTSGAANTIRYVIADGGYLNAPVTNTAITSTKNPQLAGMNCTAPAAAVASNQMVASSASRQYLAVQNQHATASIWVRPGVTAAVAGVPCIKIAPGGFWEWDGIGITSAWQFIGDAANASVAVWEG